MQIYFLLTLPILSIHSQMLSTTTQPAHATFYRAPMVTRQGDMEAHHYDQPDGSVITSYHPDVLEDGNIIGWARGNALVFQRNGRWAYLITLTDVGDTGTLVTFLNACLNFHTMKGCNHHNCKFYHHPLGAVMSNLPQRHPVSLGEVSPFVRTVKGVADLLKWSESQTLQILQSDSRAIKHAEIEAAEAAHTRQVLANQRARMAELQANIAGDSHTTDRKRPLEMAGGAGTPRFPKRKASSRPVHRRSSRPIHRLPYYPPATTVPPPTIEEIVMPVAATIEEVGGADAVEAAAEDDAPAAEDAAAADEADAPAAEDAAAAAEDGAEDAAAAAEDGAAAAEADADADEAAPEDEKIVTADSDDDDPALHHGEQVRASTFTR